MPRKTLACSVSNFLSFAPTLLALVTTLTLVFPARAQMAQQAQSTSVNHYAEAQQALLMAFYFYNKCQDGDNGACYLTALCLNQYNALMASSHSSQVSAQLASTTSARQTPAPTTPGGTVNGGTVNGATVSELVKGLQDKGLTIGPNGTTASMNGGPSVPLDSSLATKDGLMAAGLSPQQAAQTMASLGEMKDKYGSNANSNKALVGDTGGGGAGFGSRPPGDGPGGSSGTTEKKLGGDKAKLSGLSKNLGNDKIGVAGDDIFQMISRRYRANEKTLKE